jgi:large subunit ribosomal protein L10
LPNAQNIATVAELTEKMARTQMMVVADYRGMNVAEMADLRSKLREANSELIVAKNTLLRIAARETGFAAMEDLLSGPTAVTFVYDDLPKAARVLNELARMPQIAFTVRGGLLGRSLIGADGLEQVTRMPSREQVLAEIVGGVQAPLSSLVGVLDAPARETVSSLDAVINSVVYALQARVDQLQPESAAA